MDGEDRGGIDAEAELVVDHRHRLPTDHDLQEDTIRRMQLGSRPGLMEKPGLRRERLPMDWYLPRVGNCP